MTNINEISTKLKNKSTLSTFQNYGECLKTAVYQQKKTTSHIRWIQNVDFSSLAAELGFEPRQTESESAVLPLHNSAMQGLLYYRNNLLSSNN